MTLDEMIAFVSDEAAESTSDAASLEKMGWSNTDDDIRVLRSRAAALINVENALRRMKAMADEASGELA